ncbi:hypothetical protein [Hoeflea sp.]|uniref:hypothetical protein n=1 Tax=Hoeflea sp. TaxID=1940281 RepID=UPI003A944FA3
MFAPPSGAEASGWASANAKKEEAARLRALWEDPNNPNFDRRNIAVGNYTPTQSFYAQDQNNATTIRGQNVSAATSRANNAADNAGLLARQYAEPVKLNQGETAYLPQQMQEGTGLNGTLAGAPKPLSETETLAQIIMGMPAEQQQQLVGDKYAPSETQVSGQNQQRLIDSGQVTDQMLIDAILGKQSPVQALGPDGSPVFMNPGTAAREGAQPYEAASAEKIDNYLAIGPLGEEVRFPGFVGPDGRIVDANTNQVVPNVVRKEGTGGGMSFEVDGQGGVRFTTGGSGNTVSQQTNLQGQRDAATQSAQELQTLFDNISASDVGVAGNFNDFLTSYGAQVFPEVARGDVTAMRTQMQAATMRLARSLSGDSRISDTDRRMAQQIMAGQGLGESLPGAKAKIAALTVLHAYRAKFAGSLASGGEALPPITPAVIGQLVDDQAISPGVADEYMRTMLATSRGGPTRIPGVGVSPQAQTTPSATTTVPEGVDPADWEFMSAEQKALFQ